MKDPRFPPNHEANMAAVVKVRRELIAACEKLVADGMNPAYLLGTATQICGTMLALYSSPEMEAEDVILISVPQIMQTLTVTRRYMAAHKDIGGILAGTVKDTETGS